MLVALDKSLVPEWFVNLASAWGCMERSSGKSFFYTHTTCYMAGTVVIVGVEEDGAIVINEMADGVITRDYVTGYTPQEIDEFICRRVYENELNKLSHDAIAWMGRQMYMEFGNFPAQRAMEICGMDKDIALKTVASFMAK